MLSFRSWFSWFSLLLVSEITLAYNFLYESLQLTDKDVANNSDIVFGKLPGNITSKCKSMPGDATWPSIARWNAFNASLGGVLLEAVPPAAACYSGIYENVTKCVAWRLQSRSSIYVYDTASSIAYREC